MDVARHALAGTLCLLLMIGCAGCRSRSSASVPLVAEFPPQPTPAASPLIEWKVSVAGAVRAPGVYHVQPGERVADALERAGGVTDDANTASLNLARRLRDEDHILVPRIGEAAPAPAAGMPSKTDLNRASAEALEALPGIGAVRARRIVESRAKDGPFRDPSDLVTRRLVPRSVFESIKDQIEIR